MNVVRPGFQEYIFLASDLYGIIDSVTVSNYFSRCALLDG
ncbi:MAG: hypothetical protein JWO13_385 [Acidobacteriales bacterium]|nr:hypothetical protein [Terriglobales bacterium]